MIINRDDYVKLAMDVELFLDIDLHVVHAELVYRDAKHIFASKSASESIACIAELLHMSRCNTRPAELSQLTEFSLDDFVTFLINKREYVSYIFLALATLQSETGVDLESTKSDVRYEMAHLLHVISLFANIHSGAKQYIAHQLRLDVEANRSNIELLQSTHSVGYGVTVASTKLASSYLIQAYESM